MTMAISLYDVTVLSYLQTLGGVAGFMERGLKHCGPNVRQIQGHDWHLVPSERWQAIG